MGILGEFAKDLRSLGICKIDPSDDPGDPLVLVRELEEKSSLGNGGSGLDNNALVNVVFVEKRAEIGREKVAIQSRQLRREPAIVRSFRFPEVLVRVNSNHSV
jgi:hypothetical protein